MILNVPVPRIAGWDKAVADLRHIGFIQAPGKLALATNRGTLF